MEAWTIFDLLPWLLGVALLINTDHSSQITCFNTVNTTTKYYELINLCYVYTIKSKMEYLYRTEPQFSTIYHYVTHILIFFYIKF